MCCSNAPLVTDWLMVIITAVYMIATIAIFVANLVSAKSAKRQLQETEKQLESSKKQFEEQMAETKRQYEERKRLSIMPYFQCEEDKNFQYEKEILIDDKYPNGSHFHKRICIKNIGLGTAKDITFILNNNSGNHERETFVFQSAISGEKQSVEFDFIIPEYQQKDFAIQFKLSFMDLLSNLYSQCIEVYFKRINHGFTTHLKTNAVESIQRNGKDA